MNLYKSNKVWHKHTDSEKRVVLASFPNHLFLSKEEHDKRVNIEESIFNMIIQSGSEVPEQVGLFSSNSFLVFWEDEKDSVSIDEKLIKSLGLVVTNVFSEVDTGNAMAGIPSWVHTIYFDMV